MYRPQTLQPTPAPTVLATDFFADPLQALVPGAVLAILTGVEGPHYRRPGTVMTLLPNGQRVGQLSSGCIEGDLTLQAARVAETGTPVMLRYGRGSPFIDLRLPCGGGIDVALIPIHDPEPVRQGLTRRAARQPGWLGIDLETGTIAVDGPGFRLPMTPPLRFTVAGVGIEAIRFAALAQAARYETSLLTNDNLTRQAAEAEGIPLADDSALEGDDWTAITLFYHEHDLELPVLARALSGNAFYIGAQGSKRAHEVRSAALRDMGLSDTAIARLRSPIGLIRSARDPAVLSVSVLAEIIDEAAR